MLVKDFIALIDGLAPFDTAESHDNVGLLIGDPNQAVTGVMVALDASEGVFEEMRQNKANLLITHHPLMFSPVHRLLETDYEGRLILEMARGRIAMIAAHTNWDKAPGGTNDRLCSLFGLQNISGEGFIRVGELPKPMTADAFKQQASLVLKAPIVLMGNADRPVFRLGLCTGGGSDEWETAHQMGADAFLTGEMRHHHALEAAARGMTLYEAGHAATEDPGMDALCVSLQTALNRLKWNVAVYRAAYRPYTAR